MAVFEEGRLEGRTGILMGGFDNAMAGWSPGTEGLDARDGRRVDPAGFFMTSEAIVVGLGSGRSGLGSEGSRLATHRTNLGVMKLRRGWRFVVFRIWRMLCIEW